MLEPGSELEAEREACGWSGRWKLREAIQGNFRSLRVTLFSSSFFSSAPLDLRRARSSPEVEPPPTRGVDSRRCCGLSSSRLARSIFSFSFSKSASVAFNVFSSAVLSDVLLVRAICSVIVVTCFSSSLTRSWYLCWRSFHKALRAYTLNESLSPRISSLSTLAFCRRKCDSCSLVVGRIPTLTPPPLLGDNPAHMNGPWLFRRLMSLMVLASTSVLSSCVSRRMGLMKPLAMLVCCSALKSMLYCVPHRESVESVITVLSFLAWKASSSSLEALASNGRQRLWW
mmetsp:Transcript_11333/g.26696  ORF Transcript_11333/g.26696 Transcript_11333/m.26696 type:complete len:285 (+) Transcript_11333:769-1623(+)